MGLDLYITTKSCDYCHHCEWETLSYTYNVAPMWYEIYPNDGHMVNIDGLCGKYAAKKIQKALDQLKKTPDIFKALNPENGWGSYDGFVEFLERVLELSKQYPKGIWESWR